MYLSKHIDSKFTLALLHKMTNEEMFEIQYIGDSKCVIIHCASEKYLTAESDGSFSIVVVAESSRISAQEIFSIEQKLQPTTNEIGYAIRTSYGTYLFVQGFF